MDDEFMNNIVDDNSQFVEHVMNVSQPPKDIKIVHDEESPNREQLIDEYIAQYTHCAQQIGVVKRLNANIESANSDQARIVALTKCLNCVVGVLVDNMKLLDKMNSVFSD